MIAKHPHEGSYSEGVSVRPFPDWSALPGLYTTDGKPVQVGEVYHRARRVDAQGPIEVSFSFVVGCPLSKATGVWLRASMRPEQLQ